MMGPSEGPAKEWEGTGQKQKEQGQNWVMVQEAGWADGEESQGRVCSFDLPLGRERGRNC